ncbi:unnamed protein product [Larinioides sclopetarius]|uniref:Uncharacterized protein n=1 Tax=Larinioides sclopetarius TaxID=280406 RepID=A0AAV1ZSV0_9ARAC
MLELQWRLPLLSLQEMSLLRITTTLCNNRQLLRLIMKCKFWKDFDNRLYIRRSIEWAAVQAMANELISQICNSTTLSKRLMDLVWPVYYRIMMWKSIYAPSIPKKFLLHFHWTDKGKVDTLRTARCIITNKNISVRKRFVLACKACLYEEIREIWKEMSDDDKMYFFAKNRGKFCPLLQFWAHTMKGSDDVLKQFVNNACICAFENGLFDAVKYLFSIFSKFERDEMAYECLLIWYYKFNEVCFREENEIDIAYFLYFEIEYNFPGSFLLEMSLLLQFSEREHFFDVLDERLPSASSRDIQIFLYMVFFSYHLEVTKNHDYVIIFFEIWQKISASTKKEVISSNLGGHFLTVMIRDNFPFLVGKEASKIVVQLASSNWKPSTTEMPFGFHQEKWNILNFLIEERIATINSLKLHREGEGEEIPVFNEVEWNAVLRLVRKIGSKNRQQNE